MAWLWVSEMPSQDMLLDVKGGSRGETARIGSLWGITQVAETLLNKALNSIFHLTVALDETRARPLFHPIH
jgi:hypothetical protein